MRRGSHRSRTRWVWTDTRRQPYALSPALFGLLFVLAGLLARDDRKRLYALLSAVNLAVVTFLASLRGLLGIGKVFHGTAIHPATITSQTIMALLMLASLLIAARASSLARKARASSRRHAAKPASSRPRRSS